LGGTDIAATGWTESGGGIEVIDVQPEGEHIIY